MSTHCKNLFVRPSKREELISRQPSRTAAWDIAQEWAAKIVKMGIADRFGVRVDRLPRDFWGVVLVDRSIPADNKRGR
ncbi:hypothetical protein [Streptomyces werraensis]|uniref:hypothetical protein n=1 Tax=Streptomyces werraensis TaxID=68284 RepID=UPI0036F4DD57